jgi:hypothetical protein
VCGQCDGYCTRTIYMHCITDLLDMDIVLLQTVVRCVANKAVLVPEINYLIYLLNEVG